MKLIKTIIIFIILLSHNTLAENKDCNQYDKLSKKYAKCNALLLKENTSKKKNLIKNNATKKINNAKTKFNKSNFKKKLLKFKNSKSYKEYKEN